MAAETHLLWWTKGGAVARETNVRHGQENEVYKWVLEDDGWMLLSD